MTDEHWSSFSADAHLHGITETDVGEVYVKKTMPGFQAMPEAPVGNHISCHISYFPWFYSLDIWSVVFLDVEYIQGRGEVNVGSVKVGVEWGNVHMEISQLYIQIILVSCHCILNIQIQEQQGYLVAFQFHSKHPARLQRMMECEMNHLKWIERLYSTAFVNDGRNTVY